MERVKINRVIDNDHFEGESTKGNLFILEYEYIEGVGGRLYLSGSQRKGCLKVADPLFWLHFMESNEPITIEVEIELLK